MLLTYYIGYISVPEKGLCVNEMVAWYPYPSTDDKREYMYAHSA